jgi:hypothetical protein
MKRVFALAIAAALISLMASSGADAGITEGSSGIFSSTRDCRAITSQIRSECISGDCRAIVNQFAAFCESEDCFAILYQASARCQSEDCHAVLEGNANRCTTQNCKAIVLQQQPACQ